MIADVFLLSGTHLGLFKLLLKDTLCFYEGKNSVNLDSVAKLALNIFLILML